MALHSSPERARARHAIVVLGRFPEAAACRQNFHDNLERARVGTP
ncbi:MAG: hypothetical protein O2780_10445 [Proteobacteria bacterium]|nr:hypothetical protein [Pseudomonadota bacterium]MDA1300611.1 hypothetical protein [Pseudomonadota bacterium]